jgi:hypothetical protein
MFERIAAWGVIGFMIAGSLIEFKVPGINQYGIAVGCMIGGGIGYIFTR